MRFKISGKIISLPLHEDVDEDEVADYGIEIKKEGDTFYAYVDAPKTQNAIRIIMEVLCVDMRDHLSGIETLTVWMSGGKKMIVDVDWEKVTKFDLSMTTVSL